MTKKLICFSLWGDHEFYNYGALENALLAKDIYPGWTCRFYYNNCMQKIIDELSKLDNVELIKMNGVDSTSNMLWRFKPAFHEDDITVIIRDTDSRLNIKEKLAVDEWLASDKDFHIMRDHAHHESLIMGGMWGCRNNVLRPYQSLFDNLNKTDTWGVDQLFMINIIYPYIATKSFIHATYHKHEKNAVNFPDSNYKSFIGSYIRTAPLTFKLLNESERILNVRHPGQALEY